MRARAFYSSELAGYSNQSTAPGEAILNAHGIQEGTSRSATSIGDFLPREDMAQYIYNVLVDKGAKIPYDTEYLKAMSSISDFYSISPQLPQGGHGLCYTTDLLGGQIDGSFGPQNPMNRAQGYVVINRLRDYFRNNGGATTPEGSEKPVTPPDPVTPTEATTPTVTELPAFKLQGGENVQQMTGGVMTNVTYAPGYLCNGQPITEDNVKALLEEVEASMPEGTPWDEVVTSLTNPYWG